MPKTLTVCKVGFVYEHTGYRKRWAVLQSGQLKCCSDYLVRAMPLRRRLQPHPPSPQHGAHRLFNLAADAGGGRRPAAAARAAPVG